MALLLLAMTQIDVSLQKVPIIGIELKTPAPQGALVAFLYVFFVYFLIAWFWRYRSERHEVLLPIRQLQSFMERVDAQFARLQKLEPPDPSGVAASASDARKRLDGYTQELDRAIVQHISGLDKALNKAQAFLSSAAGARGGDGDFPGEGPIARLTGEVRGFVQLLEDPNRALKHVPHEVRAYVKEVMDTLAEQRKILIDEIDEKGPKISEAAVVFRKEMSDLRKQIDGRAGALFWDREILGFYVPFVFSLLLLLFTVPQGIHDVAPVFNRIKQCTLSPEWACFYRNTTALPWYLRNLTPLVPSW